MRAEWGDAAAMLGAEGVRVDLIYVDPPFNTGQRQTDRAGEYADSFGSVSEYIEWLGERVSRSVRLLKPTGSILLHVDWRTSHRARVMMDEILGEDRFVNHLIWSYGLGGSSPRRFARKHDDILFYCVDPEGYWFDPPRVPATSARMRGQMKKATDVLWFDREPEGGRAMDGGAVLEVPTINNMAAERVGYPTQKPVALLEMLVRACCPPGGVVWDPCCGSGTTAVAAVKSGRRVIVSDQSEEAVGVTRERVG
ncbi:MAG: site-specific DNA-methyltransferase [Phycisphaerales bacterium]